MSDDDLVQAVRPGLTAVEPFMFHVCNIFNLHVLFLICSNIFNLQVKFLVCSNIFNLHVWPFWATVDVPPGETSLVSKEKGLYLPANNAVKNLLKLKLYILYD